MRYFRPYGTLIVGAILGGVVWPIVRSRVSTGA